MACSIGEDVRDGSEPNCVALLLLPIVAMNVLVPVEMRGNIKLQKVNLERGSTSLDH